MRILDQYIFEDHAISGATDERTGLKKLLATAGEKPRSFDIVLADDTSRLSRDTADSLTIFKRLRFAGVRVIYVAQGIDSSSEQAELLIGVHGIVDSLYLKDLSSRTFRGVEQLALSGLHTGGRVFGYRRALIESSTACDSHGRPIIAGVKLEVDANQAPTVRRIFERYAAGHSMKRIAIDLNRDGIRSPQPREGRSQSWAQSSVRHILLNEKYRGVFVWGKTKKIRSPETGKRIYRRRPASEWRRVELAEQRIVSEELWIRTHERLKLVQDLYGVREGRRRGRALASPYLFTSLLACSECGGSITIVSGRCRKRADSRYGCSMHAQRGSSVCKNGLLVRRLDLERQLLAGLQERVLHPDVVDYTLKQFEKEFAKAIAERRQGTAELRRHAGELERGMANQLRALSDGYSPAITAEIARLEQQLSAVRERLKATDPAAAKLRMRVTRRFVESRLRNLCALWEGDPRIAREEIAKHVGKITLKPALRTYVASGIWDWLGVLGSAAAMMVPGEGSGPNVCPLGSSGWLLREAMAGEEDSFALGRQSACAEALSFYGEIWVVKCTRHREILKPRSAK